MNIIADMNGFRMRTLVAAIALVVQASTVFASHNSARRYASLQADPVICKYFLLSTKPVQECLNLTQLQIKSLESAMQASPTSIAGIVEFRRSQEQVLEEAHSDEERSKLRQNGNERAHLLIHSNWEAILHNALSPAQEARLGQLLLQMKGPHAIVEDTNLTQQLHLTAGQIGTLRQIADTYSQLLSLLRHRYLGLQIQPVRKRSDGEISSEMSSIIQVTKEIEADQDAELLEVLDPERRRAWNSLCGSPLRIDWDAQTAADIPFGGSDPHQ
jgi:hypothetical protein